MAVSKTENEDLLREELRVLVKSEFLFQDGTIPDCSFTFRHALVQDAAYQSLLKATRKQLHGQVAEILETQFMEIDESSPELLAFHLEESGQIQKSVSFWTQACQRALDSYSLQEAKSLAESGLSALHSLPESRDRDAQELVLTGMLGRVLVTSTAYTDPKVEETYSRALVLCESVGDAPQMFPLVVGMWMYFQVKGEYEESLDLAQRLLRMANTQGNLTYQYEAHYCNGFTNYFRGDFTASRSHFEQSLEIELEIKKVHGHEYSFFTSIMGDDSRVHVRSVFANLLWHYDEKEEAERLMSESEQLAIARDNPIEIVWSAFQYSVYEIQCERYEEALAILKTTVEICREKGFTYFLILSEFNLAWIEMELDKNASKEALTAYIERMEGSFGYYKMIGCKQANSHIYITFIRSLIRLGDLSRASTCIEEAFQDAEARGEYYMMPALFLTQGMLALELGETDQAHAAFEKAGEKALEIGSLPFVRTARELLQQSKAQETLKI
jgi:tetratricopeptide (TPR) repeat protein